MLKSAKDVVASGNLASMVDFAIESNRTVTSLSSELSEVKNALREIGATRAKSEGLNSFEIEGHLGRAQVVLVKPAPRVRKGVDLLASEAGVPPELYATLFVKRTVVDLAPDFEVKLASLTPAQRDAILNLVEMVSPTPRVNLPL